MTIACSQGILSMVDWRHGNFEETGKTKKIYSHEKKRSQEFPWLLFFLKQRSKPRASEIFVSQFSENNLFILTPAFNISSTIHI